ncbi:DUF6161 domain-containing protein [Tenacibaculum sp. 47A_GOM-205m]|uniref:DUF6161 domain-containing protein n=1 Tax=Tenacibaculum sp. 47A_GOM-205m TaxID=1380384 RepID=UPI00048B1563|nr:DUF6161 domain-containing protein [Tenacibaculum sp. 47A_GOM-205m]
MTTTELRKKIAETELPDWFNSATANISYPHINFSIELEGFSSIHKWLSEQINGWEEYGSLPNEFEQSKRHFVNLKTRIENFINSHYNQTNSGNLDSYWRQESGQLSSNSKFFTSDSPYTLFLIDIHQNKPDSFQGAYYYVVGSYRASNRNDFIGSLLAYEFESKDYSEIINRRSKEKSSISKLRNKFQEQLTESEKDLTEHLINANTEYKNYVEAIDTLKNNKETLINDWFEGNDENDGIKKELIKFFEESKGRRENLEIAYDKKLELSKPARYWQTKARIYFKNYKTARTILMVLIGFCAILLGAILIVAPDYIFKQVFNGNEVTIVRWSLIFIAFLALMAFAIRAVNKIMFSSLHLSRDAEERHALTFVYLSLLNEQGTSMDSEDRKLILQSLFSRSETGLLKEDSGPTMPNDFISKIINK